MHHFQYRDGRLHAEDVALDTIADAVGTPFYCYSTATLLRHLEVFRQAVADLDALVCYSVKANSNLAVLRTLVAAGAGMDVVSEGELIRALKAGAAPERIIFAGVGKRRSEMALAIEADIHSFNVESEAELRALAKVASDLGRTARIALRVNPDVDPKTHKKIATGGAETKFGVPYGDARRLYRLASELEGIEVAGVHMHIGSQLTDLAPFRAAFRLMRELILTLRADGHAIRHADLGGGLGVPYVTGNVVPPHPSEYGAIVRETLGDLGLQLAFEPGRMIAANAGILVTEVIFTKPAAGKCFVIVDAAMNDLVRPTLYDAHHEILPLDAAKLDQANVITDLVGPVCETGDYLALGRAMPAMAAGERLAVMSAGAYGAVQAGTYNSRPLVPEVLVDGDRWAVVRRRPSHEEMLELESLPDWLERG
ncbi:MAG: diaminopimelate decarboxylase [Rhizobiales bacterium]|nr:diaminopimelate decarboxylase [Hyphomicrobiales bacterium]